MGKICLAALIAAVAAPLAAQTSAPQTAVQPFVDTAGEREGLKTLTACLAHARPRWARQTLARPYLSDKQASEAAQALSGKDTCVAGKDVEVTFRTSGLVGSLAEHFVKADIGKTDMNRLAAGLSKAQPLNVTEDFALCVASKDPAAARDLILSEPGSEREAQSLRQIAAFVQPCTNPGEKLTVDLQALRALTSIALYRGLTSGSPAQN